MIGRSYLTNLPRDPQAPFGNHFDVKFTYNFPYSVGVKNGLNFTDRIKHLPAFVASKEGGNGFAEIAEYILRGK